ncbi:Spy/CpxP family protein refolding chaperone [Rhizobium sullae]|uniref:Spy/CpxP family protein refolding chaperone n=1 Tax=Rhizobium sullae TaxID=50338 RepID=UPI000B3614CC|nr:Spy/CpxP family protein refolding chaperone [Rhizobium sullae]
MRRLNRTILAATMILMPAAGFTAVPHHPAGTPENPAAESASPAPALQTSAAGGGMMGGGMMNEGMMRIMMGMMGGGGQPTPGPMGQMMSPEHVEGRIAFLRAELKVTDAQQRLWQAVAEALRANAGVTKEMMSGVPGGMMADGMTPAADMQGGMMPSEAMPATPLQRIELREKMLAARLDSLGRLKTVQEPFYASLDGAQKAVAGKLLVPAPMGMM